MRERLPTSDPDGVPGRAGPPVRALPPPEPTFADVYRECHADMVRLAYLLTGSLESAQDLVQDAFVSVHRAWPRVREPRAYLRRTVVNACTSHHRRRFRAERAVYATGPGVATDEPDELFDVLAALPARQRAAVVLRYWHDLDERAIADALDCRVGTVGSLLHRAIAQLREAIEQ